MVKVTHLRSYQSYLTLTDGVGVEIFDGHFDDRRKHLVVQVP